MPGPCSFEIPPNGETDLEVIKTVDKTIAMPGDLLTYTVRVRNNGPKPATARFVDDIPNILTLTQPLACVGTGGANCGLQASGTSQTIDRDDLTLPVGGEATYTIRGRLPDNAYDVLVWQPGDQHRSRQRAEHRRDHDDPDNNTDSVSTVVSLPEINVDISGPSVAAPGDTIQYQVDVTNNGQFDVAAVRVWDLLSAAPNTELENVSWTCAGLLGGACRRGRAPAPTT